MHTYYALTMQDAGVLVDVLRVERDSRDGGGEFSVFFANRVILQLFS